MKNKLLCIIFIVLLLGASLVQFSPADTESIKRENRAVASFPATNFQSIKDGNFAKETEKYINDTVGYRSYFLAGADKIEKYKGIEPPKGKVIYTDKDIGTKTTKKACLLVVEDKIMEVFSSNEKSERAYIDTINECATKTDSKINIYSMLIPTQLEFLPPVYRNIQTSQKKTIDNIYMSLDKRVKTVDVYSLLQRHKDEYIYFRTDHHWTMTGAYYAYKALCDATKSESVDIGDFEKKSKDDGFLGYLAPKAGGAVEDKSKDTLEWYNIDEKNNLSFTFCSYDENGQKTPYRGQMFQKKENDYKFFFKSDHPYAKIKNNSISNGKNILLIKDSYANALAPWLVNNFENVIMLDPRYFKGNINDVINEDKVTDIVFMHYVFTTTFSDYCKMMQNMWR